MGYTGATMRQLLLQTFLLAALAALQSPARACAVCGCGDPTLTVGGAEKPLLGRLRTGVEVRALEDRWAAEDGGGTILRDARSTFTVSWAPLRSLVLSASLPVAARDVVLPNLAHVQSVGVGDLDLRARVFVFQDRAFRPRHVVSVQGGVVLPTALAMQRPAGMSLAAVRKTPAPWNTEDTAIPGLLAVMPGAGATYGFFFAGTWSVQASTYLQIPVAFTSAMHVGALAQASLAMQWQPSPKAALRALADTRLVAPVEVGTKVDGNSGGSVLYAGGEALLSPFEDTMFTAAVRLPVAQALHGNQSPGPVLTAGVMRDW